MKKTALFILLFATLSASAQPAHKGNALHTMQCNQIINALQLNESKSESFRKIYMDYNDAARALRSPRTKPKTDVKPSEETIEKMILNSFDESVRSIDLKREYYAKFRTILKPSEIAKMYRTERKIRDKAVGELYHRNRH